METATLPEKANSMVENDQMCGQLEELNRINDELMSKIKSMDGTIEDANKELTKWHKKAN